MDCNFAVIMYQLTHCWGSHIADTAVRVNWLVTMGSHKKKDPYHMHYGIICTIYPIFCCSWHNTIFGVHEYLYWCDWCS